MQPVSWHHARRIAADLEVARPQRVGLESAIGAVLAQPVAALTDLPPTPSAEASGWAINGIGPWTVSADGTLADGQAVRVEQGQPLPAQTTAVVIDDLAVLEETPHGTLVLVGYAGMPSARPGMITPGSGVAEAGSAAQKGELLLKPGGVITAGTIALAAAAGVDELTIVPPAFVAPVMLETDLLASGPPRRGRDRDVIAPLLPSWVMGSGGRCLPAMTAALDPGRLADLIDSAGADITVIAGSGDPGVNPLVSAALDRLNAEILIEELATRPARNVILAELRDGRRVLALPREPAAAVIALALLLTPMMWALSAQTPPRWSTVMFRDGLPTPTDHECAVAVVIERGELADLAAVQPWTGPHGLGALAGADGIAFLDPGRGSRGDSVPVIGLPGLR